MKNEDLWLIFGCSPFINSVQGKIPELLKNYHSIGVNRFPAHYQDCEYWLFNDAGIFSIYVKPYYYNQKLIVNKKLDSELKTVWINQFRCIIQDKYVINPHYMFETVINEPVLENNGKLFGAGTSILHAVNYAILQGAKEAVLIGIDLDPDWHHFYTKKHETRRERDIKTIKNHLNQLGSHIKLYKANVQADLDIEYLDIELI
jgi:hypothetical protein